MSEKKKAPRLTEAEVHEACDEFVSRGQAPTSKELLKHFGRGSLTTFTEFMRTWAELRKEKKEEIAALPIVVEMPEQLNKDGRDLVQKIWHTAKIISDQEIEAERERLRLSEKEMQARLNEVREFSEDQASMLDDLQSKFDGLFDDHHELTKNYAALEQKLKDEQAKTISLQAELTTSVEQANGLAETVSSLETKVALIEQEKVQLMKTVAERDAAIIDAKKSHESAVAKLESKHGEELARLTKAHDQALSEIKAVTNKALSDAENSHKVIVDQLNAVIVGLTADKQSQSESIKELQNDIKSLQNDAKALQKQLDETKKQQKQPVSAKNKAEKQAAIDEKS
jgi:chromosome segregation ATPase